MHIIFPLFKYSIRRNKKENLEKLGKRIVVLTTPVILWCDHVVYAYQNIWNEFLHIEIFLNIYILYCFQFLFPWLRGANYPHPSLNLTYVKLMTTSGAKSNRSYPKKILREILVCPIWNINYISICLKYKPLTRHFLVAF